MLSSCKNTAQERLDGLRQRSFSQPLMARAEGQPRPLGVGRCSSWPGLHLRPDSMQFAGHESSLLFYYSH